MAVKSDLIISVARNCGDFILDGVPASLTGSTVDHLNLIFPLSQQMQGAGFYIYSGAGAGQERVVGSFTPASHRMVFPQVFASIPSVNSAFLVTKKFLWGDYKNALDRYMGIARSKHLVDKVATLALVATQYEYPVPSGMEYIQTLRIVPTGNSDYAADSVVDSIFEIPQRFWRIEKNVGGSYTISVDPRKINLGEFDNYICRVNGQSRPDLMGSDNATALPELEEYLINGATMHMASLLPQTNTGGLNPLFYMYKDVVKGSQGSPGLEDYIYTYPSGKKVTG